MLQLLLPVDPADAGGALLEVRAGTGGEEAALFAADLFRMYRNYSEACRWKFEVAALGQGLCSAVLGPGILVWVASLGVQGIDRSPNYSAI